MLGLQHEHSENGTGSIAMLAGPFSFHPRIFAYGAIWKPRYPFSRGLVLPLSPATVLRR